MNIHAVTVYLGCLIRVCVSGINILWVKTVFFSVSSTSFFFRYIDKAEIRAGTKNMDNNKAMIVPTAVNIPKSLIIVRYEPKTNETKPIAVVIAANMTGMITYATPLINACFLS